MATEAQIPRLFAGIEIPPGVAQQLALLRGGLFGARWIDPENYHVTLRFVGDVDTHAARELLHELARVRRPPVRVALDGLSVFGGDRPRAVIARIKPNRELSDLQAELERAARKIGLEAETRKFTPHVTLARLRKVKPAAVAEYLGVRGFLPPHEFVADRFAVFSSRESTGGGPYIVEATYPLFDARAQQAVDG